MIVDRDHPASGVLQQRDVKQNTEPNPTEPEPDPEPGRRSAIGARRRRRGRVGDGRRTTRQTGRRGD